MAYGVAVTRIYKGRVLETKLVCAPMGGNWNHFSSGNMDYARALCQRMRDCEAKYQVPNQAIAYTVVPLPVAG
jgi:hypothetical protein